MNSTFKLERRSPDVFPSTTEASPYGGNAPDHNGLQHKTETLLELACVLGERVARVDAVLFGLKPEPARDAVVGSPTSSIELTIEQVINRVGYASEALAAILERL